MGTVLQLQYSREMPQCGVMWVPSSSMLAAKYQKYGYVHMEPFLPGERRRAAKEMERSVKGYKKLREELHMARNTLEKQEKSKYSLEKNIQTTFYKSPVGTRTTKLSGGVFSSLPVARSTFFSGMKRV